MTKEQDKLGEAIDDYDIMCKELGHPLDTNVELYKAAKAYHQIKPLLDSLKNKSLDFLLTDSGSPKEYNNGRAVMCEWFLDKISEIMKGGE